MEKYIKRYIIYRDDHMYPISAGTFEELNELRNQGNHSFMSHYYGPVCYDNVTKKYYNIVRNEEVTWNDREW